MSEQTVLNGGGTPHRLYRKQYTVLVVLTFLCLLAGIVTGAALGWLKMTEVFEALAGSIGVLLVFTAMSKWMFRGGR